MTEKLPYENDPIANLYDIILNLEGVISDYEHNPNIGKIGYETIKRSSRRIAAVIDELNVSEEK